MIKELKSFFKSIITVTIFGETFQSIYQCISLVLKSLFSIDVFHKFEYINVIILVTKENGWISSQILHLIAFSPSIEIPYSHKYSAFSLEISTQESTLAFSEIERLEVALAEENGFEPIFRV